MPPTTSKRLRGYATPDGKVFRSKSAARKDYLCRRADDYRVGGGLILVGAIQPVWVWLDEHGERRIEPRPEHQH